MRVFVLHLKCEQWRNSCLFPHHMSFLRRMSNSAQHLSFMRRMCFPPSSFWRSPCLLRRATGISTQSLDGTSPNAMISLQLLRCLHFNSIWAEAINGGPYALTFRSYHRQDGPEVTRDALTSILLRSCSGACPCVSSWYLFYLLSCPRCRHCGGLIPCRLSAAKGKRQKINMTRMSGRRLLLSHPYHLGEELFFSDD